MLDRNELIEKLEDRIDELVEEERKSYDKNKYYQFYGAINELEELIRYLKESR